MMRRVISLALLALATSVACRPEVAPARPDAPAVVNTSLPAADSTRVAGGMVVDAASAASGVGKGTGTLVPLYQSLGSGAANKIDGELLAADELIVLSKDLQEHEELAAGSRRMAARSVMVRSGLVAPERDTTAAPAAVTTVRASLLARTAAGDSVGEFPLKHTEVSAEVSAYLARTVVEQRYANPFEQAIEAVYTFPLPSMAAVNDFVMRIGDRTIVGVVRPRDEAERIYRAARARGQTASLLTQERPNIFTQSVANIAARGEVTIRITYVERLPYEDGRYEYVFPMVVGPRYIPGGQPLVAHVASPTTDDGQGTGTVRPTGRVPDADRISPPVLRPGERSGHDIALTVRLDAGVRITSLTSVAHDVREERESASRRIVRLAARDAIPNRDFVLRWSVGGDDTQFGVLAHRDSGAAGASGGYFTLTMLPPSSPADAQVTPREITFILDISGSMSGLPLEISKSVVRRTLDRLRPDDQFNIVYFAGGNGQLWQRAHPNTPANVAAAKRFLDDASAGGGTEMLAGVQRALRARHDAELLQMFVFCTDGYVGNEDEILRVVKEERGDARFFAFGIGGSVNRYLIDGIGEHGAGASEVVLPRDPRHAERAVDRLFDLIDSPVLVDVGIDWNGLPVSDIYPARLRDLFAGQTIAIVGRYTGAARGVAYVTGRVGARRVRWPVRIDLPARDSANAALAPTWARFRIADLSEALLTAGADDSTRLRDEITTVALAHRLVSQYTAFVAVDESRIVGDGRPLRIVQPVELPEGVSYEGIFGGEKPLGEPVRIGAWGLDLQATDSGLVRVGDVGSTGAARGAGIRRGAALRAINGTPVRDVGALESLLLQSPGPSVRASFDPGGEVSLPAP